MTELSMSHITKYSCAKLSLKSELFPWGGGGGMKLINRVNESLLLLAD